MMPSISPEPAVVVEGVPSRGDDAAWVECLSRPGDGHDDAVARLHDLLLRGAYTETRRRSGPFGVVGPELDDLAQQAADDAFVAVLGKLSTFRGDSRFSTWAYKFVIFEAAGKITRHHWQRRTVTLDDDGWAALPTRLGMSPEDHAEYRELTKSVRRAVSDVLSERQRLTFVAIVVDGVPLDELVASTGSTRGAIYKVMFDARRKIRAALVADGHVRDETMTRRGPASQPAGGVSMTGWLALDRLLDTDPRDGGCDLARDLVDVYAERLHADRAAARQRYPEIAAHIRACGPCADDLEGVLFRLDAHR